MGRGWKVREDKQEQEVEEAEEAEVGAEEAGVGAAVYCIKAAAAPLPWERKHGGHPPLQRRPDTFFAWQGGQCVQGNYQGGLGAGGEQDKRAGWM